MMLRRSLIFLFIILLSSPAYAHRSYLEKLETIKDSEGNVYILEKRNGDSVIGFSDPYVLQIRAMNGHVLAITRAQLPVYCYTLEDCRAFGKPGPVRFDEVYIKNKAKEVLGKVFYPSLSAEERKQFEDYLTNPDVKHSLAYGQTYPEHEDGLVEFGVLPDDRPYPLIWRLQGILFAALFITLIVYMIKRKKKTVINQYMQH